MKNIIIIPIAIKDDDLSLPLGRLNGITLLETVYKRAKEVTACDNVVVTSSNQELGRFCSLQKLTFFPSSEYLPTGTHRCADIAAKFKPDAKVGNVICWPLTYPSVSAYDINELIANYIGGVGTLATNVQPAYRDEFNSDDSLVKVRAFGSYAVDFSRCPLPLALCHVGIYMYALPELLRVGQIAPTKLSIEERLEQLAWLQYQTKITITVASTRSSPGFPVAIRSVEQLNQLNEKLQGQVA